MRNPTFLNVAKLLEKCNYLHKYLQITCAITRYNVSLAYCSNKILRMKTHLNTPENTDVFSANANTWKLAKSFILTGTLIGIVTEFSVLYAAIIAHIAVLLPGWAWVSSACIAVTAFLVFVLARERIRTGRQAAKIAISKEGRGLGWIANIAVLVSCFVVFGASFALSWLGAAEGVTKLLPEPKVINTTIQDSTLIATKQGISAEYRSDSATIAKTYAQQIKAVQGEYWAKISTWEKRRKASKTEADRQWCISRIEPLKTERDGKVNALRAEQAAKIGELTTSKRSTIAQHEGQTIQSKQIYIDHAGTKADRLQWFADKAQQWIPITIVASLFLMLIGLFLDEKFKAKAGIKEVVLPNKYDLLPSFSEEAKEAGTIILNSWGRSLINGIKHLKTNPTIEKTMDDLIEMKLNSYRKTIYEIGDKEEKQQIGFKIGEKPTDTIKNEHKTNDPVTEEHKPGKHLNRIFNKRGVGEIENPAKPDIEIEKGKIVTLDFAARQAATYKSLAKSGQRDPVRTAALANYWADIVETMKTQGLVTMKVPDFNIDEWK